MRANHTAGRFLGALLAALFLSAALPAIVAAQSPAREATREDMLRQVLDRDLAAFVSLLEGRYDNELQVFFDADLKTPHEMQSSRIHAIFRKVDAPALGRNVFFGAQYADGDSSRITLQGLYVASADYAANAIRLAMHTPKTPNAFAGAYRNPEVLAAVTPEQLIVNPACDVLWRREEAQFRGSMQPGVCRTVWKPSGRTITVEQDYLLGPDRLWIRDRGMDEQGRILYGHRTGEAQKLRKVRPFSCWVFALRGANHGDSGEGNSNWQSFYNVLIHDQGGIAAVTTDETPVRTIRLRLRNVEWPFGSNRPSLTLYVLDGDKDRAVSYAWTESTADRVGLNLRWVQASCTFAPEKLWAVE